MKKLNLSLLLLCASMIGAKPDVAVSVDRAKPTLNIVDENGKASFSVEEGLEGPKPISPLFVDKQIRNVATEKLVRMLAKGDGYLRLRRIEDGEYGLQCHIRGNGGGPGAGYAAYCLTKGALYGLLGASVVGASAITGGAVAGAISGVGAAAGAAAAAAGTAAAGTAVSTGVAAGTVAGTMIGAAVAETAGVAGAGAVLGAGVGAATAIVGGEIAAAEIVTATMAAGGVAGIVTGIEAASIAVGVFFGLAPTV